MLKRVGANITGNRGCEFVVWSPIADSVELEITSSEKKPMKMNRDIWGYWSLSLDNISPGARYRYVIDGKKTRPDPASYYQPEGVHAPSCIIDHAGFPWEDKGWVPVALRDMIIYEIHTGTFTEKGTFDAVIPRLDEIADTGINALEIMPVAQFPGDRNWGYDGVYPYAVQNSYGGPDGLKRLVNECHKRGLSVIMDVVYNHLGPEGNYLWDYGPYFTDRYRTPWGDAVNFDGEFSDGVRNFFINNALHWFENYHIDALRLDAVHAIYDMSAYPFLKELVEKVKEYSGAKGKNHILIAESNLNDVRIINPPEKGGYGFDAQWSDDLHHSLHSALTGEKDGYYVDFGNNGDIVKALREGFVYTGQYSRFRKRRHGSSAIKRPTEQFVVFSQNHDQTGNRARGERLSQLVGFEQLKLCAGIVILSPYVPLLFMGEEYGEESPFLYFVSHSDQELIRNVREGRKKEFGGFPGHQDPPDPLDENTYLSSRIRWHKRNNRKNSTLLDFYRELMGLRKSLPPLANPRRDTIDVYSCGSSNLLIFMQRWCDRRKDHVCCVFNPDSIDTEFTMPACSSRWIKVLDSAEEKWYGPGSELPVIIDDDSKYKIEKYGVAVYRCE